MSLRLSRTPARSRATTPQRHKAGKISTTEPTRAAAPNHLIAGRATARVDVCGKTGRSQNAQVDQNGAVLPVEESKKDDEGNTILKVKGHITAEGKGKIPTRLFAGVPFESSYLFTTIGIRNQNNTAVTTGRLQLRSLSLNLYRTGYICARVKPKGRSTFENIFTGKKLGEVSSTIGQIPIYTGQIKVPVLSRNDMVDITVMSSSYLPFSLVNADWEGFYSARSQRV